MLIFLDFDGCLHPVNARIERLFESADLLIEILAPYPAAQVVLSTSWVYTHGYEVTRDFLPDALQARIIGATVQKKRSTRYGEISSYVATHQPARWLALDDCIEGWPAAERIHLIQTPVHLGLSCPRATAALQQALAAE
jgi:hypothetical protein